MTDHQLCRLLKSLNVPVHIPHADELEEAIRSAGMQLLRETWSRKERARLQLVKPAESAKFRRAQPRCCHHQILANQQQSGRSWIQRISAKVTTPRTSQRSYVLITINVLYSTMHACQLSSKARSQHGI